MLTIFSPFPPPPLRPSKCCCCFGAVRHAASSALALRSLAHLLGGVSVVAGLLAASMALGMVSTPEWEVARHVAGSHYPTNIGIVRCTVSVATIVVVGAGVDI